MPRQRHDARNQSGGHGARCLCFRPARPVLGKRGELSLAVPESIKNSACAVGRRLDGADRRASYWFGILHESRSAVTGGTRVISDWLVVRVSSNPGESFLDRMISMVEGAKRQKTPNEIALSILLAGLTIIFLIAVATLAPFSLYAHKHQSVTVLIALLVCLIPTTIGGLLSAIGIAGMDRVMQHNVLAMSGRAVEAAGDVNTLLLELAAALQGRPRIDDVYLVFFDGEEAIHEWTATDSIYGSRHLAAKWTADGTNARLKALINVDMTGDKNLRLLWDENSAPSVRKLVWDVADSLGYSAAFPRRGNAIEDDHIPFINAGVRAVDLIDFDSQSTFWHTPQDTMDKLDPHSFDVIGAVVLKSIEELEQQK